MQKRNITILIVALIVISGAYLFINRDYPVAFVGSSSVLNSNFQESYLISYNFYSNNMKADNQDAVILKSDDIIKELKRATLDVLIGQKIINAELEKRIKSDDLEKMIDEKISKIDLSSDNFKKGSEFLYGTSVENVKNLVLISKIKEEILQGRLTLENSQINLDEWLKQKKAETKVEILMPEFYWDKGEVGVK